MMHPLIAEAQAIWRNHYGGDMRGWVEGPENFAIRMAVENHEAELIGERMMAEDSLPRFPAPLGVALQDIPAGAMVELDGVTGKVKPADTFTVATHGFLIGPPGPVVRGLYDDTPGPIDDGEGEPVVFTPRQKQALALFAVAWVVLLLTILAIVFS